MPEATIERMRGCLAALDPVALTIEDDSARHVGHAGAASGGGHYNIRMTSPHFEGKSRVERHRLVYHALADLLKRDIHALAMVLLAPGESEQRAGAPLSDLDHIPGK